MSQRDASLYRSDPRPAALTDAIVRYYDAKTERILEKYGPGPRVHFHTGINATTLPVGASMHELRDAMVFAQESLLGYLLPFVRGKRILDVGCGLGGSAIYLAEKLGVHVTAITIVPNHVRVVNALARSAGQSARVRCLVADANALATREKFDVAIAIESSCYLDRAQFFGSVRDALTKAGELHVIDCFVSDHQTAITFDRYWQTCVGALDEYATEAHEAGFTTSVRDLTPTTIAFWELSQMWTRAKRATQTVAPHENLRLARSLREHAWLQAATRRGLITYRHAVFRQRIT